MKRLVFTLFLLFHGLLHLPSFITAFSLARINELTGKTLLPLSGISIKIAGILWLFTGLLFTITAIAYLVKKYWWWLAGAIAIIISQVLIIIFWPDAKFGTIINIILLLPVVAGYGNWRFQALVRQELQRFINPINQPKVVLTAEMLTSLSPIVQQWLLRSQVAGKEVIQTVHLKQAGQMRTQPTGRWMPITAEQYFTIPTPGFLWLADVKVAPLVHLAGRDKYYQGHGHMLIKLFSL